MKRISGVQIIINFIGKHPGCTFPGIRQGTGLNHSVVNSAIWAMVNDGRVKRSGEHRHYQYTLTKRAEVTEEAEEKADFDPYYGCSNPLTHIFNQRLAAVRAAYGRMG